MVRRIKAYLAGVRVCSDEDELTRMSAECEPLSVSGSMGGGSLGSVSGSSLTLGNNCIISAPGAGGGACAAAAVGRTAPSVGNSPVATATVAPGGGGNRRSAASPTLSATSSTSSTSDSAHQRLMAASAAMVVSVSGPKCTGNGGGGVVIKARRLTNPEEKIVATLGPEAAEACEHNDSVFHGGDAQLPAQQQHRAGAWSIR